MFHELKKVVYGINCLLYSAMNDTESVYKLQFCVVMLVILNLQIIENTLFVLCTTCSTWSNYDQTTILFIYK